MSDNGIKENTIERPYFCYINSNYVGDYDNIKENNMYGIIDLTKPPFLGELSNDLFAYKWNYITQGQAIQKIVKFEKQMVARKFHVLISGKSESEYMDNIEKFLHWTDVDINNLKMGRLYIGKYYLECYIFQSTKPKRYLNTTKTLVELTIISEQGNWQRDRTIYYRSGQNNEYNEAYTATGITYNYDYNYDYASPFGKDTFVNESYMDTDFEMIFYGALDNPQITIGGNVYEINKPIGRNEYMVINTRKKTALLYRYNGEVENVFKHRNKEHYIYEKIKGGGNVILVEKPSTINGGKPISIDIRLFYERSEPKWSKNLWT